jgi:hypothetical protein
MALKDWKKTLNQKYRIEWLNRKSNIGIYIFWSRNENSWFFRYYKFNMAHHEIGKFKSKSQALKFAKAYLRTH